MKVSELDYELPESSIAIYPPERRGDTKLLVQSRQTGDVEHSRYADLDGFLGPGDLLVLNNTKVVRARLHARKQSGAAVELLLLEQHAGLRDLVLYKGRMRTGDLLLAAGYVLEIIDLPGNGIARVRRQDGGDVAALFDAYAEVPVPPYLGRCAEELDGERYQTVFAHHPGSVAAPTASLNLTERLLERIQAKGVTVVTVTLHVGIGTFLPLRVDSCAEHQMHREFYTIPLESVVALRRTRACGGRVVAVGTTVSRALEHAAARIVDDGAPRAVQGEADLFIYPGYRFQMIDALVTNFHAPRSTVLFLTAAFAGADYLRQAYAEALREGYRFLSYGDSMLIF